MSDIRRLVAAVAVVAALSAACRAQGLPQDHEYQRGLRAFMATLTEKDFQVEAKPFAVQGSKNPEDLYRTWLLTLDVPDITFVAMPASAFTLQAVEGKDGIVAPDVRACQTLAWLASWDYPGNPCRGSRAIKLRAFVLSAIDVIMIDNWHEKHGQGTRSDFLGGNLIWIGYTYSKVRDILPPAAAAAYTEGVKKLVLRLNEWGPTGQMTDMDLFAPVGLWYISRAMGDPQVAKIAEEYSRRLFTEERFFHPAGYFVDNGCFDTSYNGISLYFSAWAALASDWTFAKDALTRAYRLRAHLCFPDPDGAFFGPSEMSSRTSGDPPGDQWQFAPRHYGAAMITDEAAYLTRLPDEAGLRGGVTAVIADLNAQLARPLEAKPQPWGEMHWSSGSFAARHYPEGYYPHRAKLQAAGSPLLQPLYLRKENFVRAFEKAFLIAKFDGYAVAVHTGPVGGVFAGWKRPCGFGGGELSAFWTPRTGSVMLGRRRGIQGRTFDSFQEWRIWPIHAVTGITADGMMVSSSRIARCDAEYKLAADRAEVRVAGVVPKHDMEGANLVDTDLQYERRFRVEPSGLTITTSLKSEGKEKLTELYETIPVFLRDAGRQGEEKRSKIRFQVDGKRVDALPQPQANVKAVEVERFNGGIVITFDRPRTVMLSPAEWADGYMTGATCRTVLVDLIDGPSRPAAVTSASVEYKISPAQ